MDFSYSEEQQLLQDSVNRFVQDNYDFPGLAKRRELVASDEGFSREFWGQFAELGWLSVPFSEDDGGIAGTSVEDMIMMEAFGKGLVVEPFLQTVIFAGGFLKNASDAQREAHISGIIDGSKIWAVAYAEPKGRYNLADLSTTAKKDGGDFVLNGDKAVVSFGGQADKLIVTARTSGGQRDADGVSVFIVDASADGVTRRSYPTIDGLRAAEISFENVKVSADDVIGDVDGGLPLVEKVVDNATIALCAEALGEMEVLKDTTLEYTKNRVQFDQPIGKFQVLQHRQVDMFMAYEQSKSIILYAVLSQDTDPDDHAKVASAAKAQIGKASRFIGQQSVQLHGGMGMTDEMHVGHYFKRLTMIDSWFGATDHHLKRYGENA